jgi:hypothetical protein
MIRALAVLSVLAGAIAVPVQLLVSPSIGCGRSYRIGLA